MLWVSAVVQVPHSKAEPLFLLANINKGGNLQKKFLYFFWCLLIAFQKLNISMPVTRLSGPSKPKLLTGEAGISFLWGFLLLRLHCCHSREVLKFSIFLPLCQWRQI